ncbi:N-acyl homoserine lactonase family protein [Massilia arenosa]|uniref:N-acyl homoserine lactonase family protein n=1 Tax=Zemynaea arenosa TaxID=2561931 RepID=A0A4Y9SH91_9BURK|nr:N-acyl homoserine lactonase family protein [Massilia arenosa]TFW19732.1 N-acyl homoserine lactonase family protein [Massilia arenosa]
MTRTLRALGASLVLATVAAPAALAASAAPAPVKSLRVYVLDCGTIDVADISQFSPGVNVGKHKKLTDTCYLIAHPKGTLVWDTGLPDALAEKKDGMDMGKSYHLKRDRTLASQIKAIGYDPLQVTYLGISHMHFDHIGNVGLFPKSTLLMQKEEYASAFGPDAAKYGNDPKTYPTLKDNPVQELTGDHDVFGDGSVVIKRAIGHTPGHQSLFLKLPKTGNVVLSGDLAHFTENWANRRVPSFNYDKELSVKAMNEMGDFLKANKAVLWIQHDYEQNAQIKHAPAFIE